MRELTYEEIELVSGGYDGCEIVGDLSGALAAGVAGIAATGVAGPLWGVAAAAFFGVGSDLDIKSLHPSLGKSYDFGISGEEG